VTPPGDPRRLQASVQVSGLALPIVTASAQSDERVLCDAVMRQIDAMATAVAAGQISVLILGETGTGKELLAQAIHERSRRAGKTFLRLNCAALSEGLMESELFGHEQGAFTGALRARPGLFEAASGGTVLLDEVGEMSPALQAKLLRVIESGEVIRVGAVRPRPVDVRVVSATNRALDVEAERGGFRRDLYYRLSGAVLSIPPLRERPDDLVPLARLFLARAAEGLGRRPPALSAAALDRLRRHPWPGNVRELRNVVERALLLCQGDTIGVDHLGLGAAPPGWRPPRPRHLSVVASLPEQSEPGNARQRIIDALDRCAGNQTRAARLLGISRGTLVSRLTEYGLPRPRKKSRL
jgi:two-component system response regulator AtoC